jgi:alkylated DNA nucleotide flippase Atl1
MRTARSPAFARIHRDVMQVVARIPRGRVTTYLAIGEFLDVVPRQVAFLLARQNDELRESVPWWRVVGADGALGRPKRATAGASQRDLLAAEAIPVRDGKVEGLAERLFLPTTRNTGVRPVRRGA